MALPDPHGLDSAYHVGTIDDTQAPQFLKTDGSRQLAANLAVAAGVTVDGVDISVLKNNYDAHLGNPLAHSYVRNVLDDASAILARVTGTNDIRIYGADGVSVASTATGLRISGSGVTGSGGGTFLGVRDNANIAVLPSSGYLLTSDDGVVNVDASGENTLAFSVNQSQILHGSIGGKGKSDHHTAFIGLVVGAATVSPSASDTITLSAGSPIMQVTSVGSTITLDIDPESINLDTLGSNLSWSRLSKTGGSIADIPTRSHTLLTDIGTNTHATIDSHIAATVGHGATGAVVGTTNTQTLTNKTLTTPTISATGFTNAQHAHVGATSGGQIAHTSLSSIGTNTHATIDLHLASVANPHSVTKAQVGLSVVENTALSTWAGTSNITTLGTISTGTWQGTAIANAYVAGINQDLLTTSSPTFAGLIVDTNTLYVDKANHRVGIGTTGPLHPLHVSRATGAGQYTTLQVSHPGVSTNQGNVRFLGRLGYTSSVEHDVGSIDMVGINNWNSVGINVATSAMHFRLQHQNTFNEKLTILSSGNVGIGTTGPGAKLEVRDTSSTVNTSGLFIDKDSIAGGVGLKVKVRSTLSNRWAAQFLDSSDNVLMGIRSDGNVGIGTTNPAFPLDVDGSGHFFGDLEVDSDLDVGSGIMFVDYSNQNVGINTYTPDTQFALDVNGPIRGTVLVGPHAIQLPNAKAIFHFDGPDGNDDYTGDSRSHMGLRPTTETAVIYRPGKFGKAVQVAEATTNLVLNPSGETGTTGWSAPYGIVSTSLSQALYGNYSIKHVGTVSHSASRLQYAISGLTPSTTYTFSVYVYTPVGNIGLPYLNVSQVSGTHVTGAAFATLYGEWERISTTITLPSDVTSVYFRVYTGALQTIYIDGAQAEAKSYATPYCDGSLGSGHAWTGTAHASTSTRARANLRYSTDVLDVNKGTISVWYKSEGYSSSDANQYVFGHYLAGNRISVRVLADGRYDCLLGSVLNVGANAFVSVGAWQHIVLVWDNGYYSFYVNGISAKNGVYYGLLELNSFWGPGQHTGSAAYYANGLIDDVVVVAEALDADTIRAIYESNAPIFAESSTHTFRAGRGTSIWADESGFWAKAQDGTDLFAIAAVDGESWGGKTLDAGDVLMGTGTSYIHFDKSAGTTTFAGNGAGLTAINGSNITTGTIAAARMDLSGKLTVGGAAADVNANTTTISGGKITADSITSTQIAANAITTSELAADSVTSAKIVAGTIVASDIASNTITATQIAVGTITATEIAASTITGAKIAAGTITATNIAADTITATQIAANAITASELAANSVTSVKIVAGTIVASDIATGTITATQIAAGTITADKINVADLFSQNATVAGALTIGTGGSFDAGAFHLDDAGALFDAGTGDGNKLRWVDGSNYYAYVYGTRGVAVSDLYVAASHVGAAANTSTLHLIAAGYGSSPELSSITVTSDSGIAMIGRILANDGIESSTTGGFTIYDHKYGAAALSISDGGNTTIAGKTGIGGAYDLSYSLKVTGDAKITGKLGIADNPGTYALKVNGTARINSLGIADDPGTYTLKVNGDTYLGNYVGIGTGATSDRLTIAGDLSVWDDVLADNIVLNGAVKLLQASTPSTPAASSTNIYAKDGKIVFQSNYLGVTYYKWTTVDTTAGWTVSTTAP